MRMGSSKIAILLLAVVIFQKSIYKTKIVTFEYVAPDGFSSTSKQMTLNDLE